MQPGESDGESDARGRDGSSGELRLRRGDKSLRHVRAAQLRAKAIRWSLGKTFFGILFLLGALAHALGPDPSRASTPLWIALLLVLSTVNIGLGLRGIARVRRKGLALWLPATIAYGLSATVMLRLVAGL